MDITLGRKAVLIIDDFQNMRAQLSQMLGSLGVQRKPDVAGSAEEALELLRSRRYDIVLCDYNLGEGMHGQQLLDLARREGCVDVATVFIMVTAENSTEMVMGALESGPDAYLAKPISKELLNARLLKALRRRVPMSPVAQVLRQGDTEQALQLLDTMLAAGRGERADILRLKAELALETGALDLVQEVCEAVIRERPVAWAITSLGQAAMARGELSRAETLFRQAIVVTPYFMAAHDHLAAVLELQGRSRDALEVLEQAVVRSSRSLSRQRRLGWLSMQQREWELARSAWRQVIELGKPMESVRAEDYFNLVCALLEMGESARAAKALEEMQQSVAADPLLRWWFMLGRLHLAIRDRDDKEAALDALDGLMLKAIPPLEVHKALIEVLGRLGEVTRAELLRQQLPD
ncbi:response regulator [Ectothiorhodospira lacustris]|uniref:response regulator n=1 Tax=Ectothiorhodospira lacustris TaxID=2899127 RepID=UPI001EE8FF84|nr:response regulator [Ectothiorhodospira lacustris]MCG5499851.1 response regulator [Ectothiorhodospira lacustris]MCG5508999.1 response regulator [Ectothiorhodospira lacustris]MCG5520790.1 response regulator [Ectothiorhodospira lacustris]